jgi:hypothetical protein
MSNQHFRQRLFYRLQPKKHYVYLVWCPTEQKSKLGRTCRISHRLKNLRQALWTTDEQIYIVRVHTSSESLKLERFLKKTFCAKHVIREWFSGVSPEDLASVLTHDNGFAHLLLVPYADQSKVVESAPRPSWGEAPSFQIRLD